MTPKKKPRTADLVVPMTQQERDATHRAARKAGYESTSAYLRGLVKKDIERLASV